MVTRLHRFSRASCQLQVITSSFDWFTGFWVLCDWSELKVWCYQIYDTQLKTTLSRVNFLASSLLQEDSQQFLPPRTNELHVFSRNQGWMYEYIDVTVHFRIDTVHRTIPNVSQTIRVKEFLQNDRKLISGTS